MEIEKQYLTPDIKGKLVLCNDIIQKSGFMIQRTEYGFVLVD